MISPPSACDYCDMHHATKLPILASLALALAACPGTTPNDYLETTAADAAASSSSSSGTPDDPTASTEADDATTIAATTEDATGIGEGGGGGEGTVAELSGSSGGSSTGGEPCPPCPGPTECAEHQTPDGICEDVCDVLDLACEPCGLTPYDCGLAHWLCSQGDDPCGVVADKGNDQAGHLCACAMACDPPAP